MTRLNKTRRKAFAVFLMFAGLGAGLGAPTSAVAQSAVASAHPAATEAGLEVLRQGGNAFDAAVAVSAALAVVEPQSSGLGGGGLYLLYRAKDKKYLMLDAREQAPLAAHADMYLDAAGNPRPNASLDGPLAAAIPGEPAALAYLAKHYGRLPLARSLAPAIQLAQEGFTVDARYTQFALFRRGALAASTDAANTFLRLYLPPLPGVTIRQPELAATLTALASQGHDGFYRGEVAAKLVQGVKAGGGIWTLEDLQSYRLVLREPVRSQYHGMTVVSAAPPSAGGSLISLALNQLTAFDLKAMSETERTHHVVETMRRAYRERAALGDPDYVDNPLSRLLDPAYAKSLSATLDPARATPSQTTEAAVSGGTHTTHFSIIDDQGNRVAATLSINYPFGSGFVPPGTGVLLNDEMDDFSAKPGAANAYGLVGSMANSIAPGKRPLSSMSPTFLETPDRLAIVGTPGGSRIPSMVLLATLAFVDGAGAPEMVALPRYHHQFLPDYIEYEEAAFSPEVAARLQAKGHQLKQVNRRYGDMQAVICDRRSNQLQAASDPRGGGVAKVQGKSPAYCP